MISWKTCPAIFLVALVFGRVGKLKYYILLAYWHQEIARHGLLPTLYFTFICMAFESWDPTFRLLVGLPWVVELWLCVGHRAEWPGILKVNLSDHLLDNNVLHMTPWLQRHFSQWMRQGFEEETVNFKILVFLGQCCWPKVLTTKKVFTSNIQQSQERNIDHIVRLLDMICAQDFGS